MSFLQFRIHNSQHPEFVDEVLMVAGALSVSFVDAADDPVLEPGPGETPLWTQTVVLGLFDPAVAVNDVEQTLRTQVPDGADLRIETELVEDQDWVRAWLIHWEPLRFGRRLWVTPGEKRDQIPAQPDAVIMTLDPGLAFGTGTHPTTALCLAWLDAQDLTGKTVIDYGCGSGILAIAALLLGAERVVCVDIDPQALTATQQNAATNGVGDKIETYLPDDFSAAPADFVLANILAGPLKALAPTLAASLVPGGRLVLAGLLDRQAEELHACYAPYLTFEPDLSQEGWTRIAGQRLQNQT
jgi:ribosomal protein L11 methyltransferase